jgi:uncharacterized protein (TIGR02145 family)
LNFNALKIKNKDETNAAGFSTVEGGMIYHEFTGSFASIAVIGPLWSSTEYDSTRAFYRLLAFDDAHFISKRGNKRHGMCVRCVKDL